MCTPDTGRYAYVSPCSTPRLAPALSPSAPGEVSVSLGTPTSACGTWANLSCTLARHYVLASSTMALHGSKKQTRKRKTALDTGLTWPATRVPHGDEFIKRHYCECSSEHAAETSPAVMGRSPISLKIIRLCGYIVPSKVPLSEDCAADSAQRHSPPPACRGSREFTLHEKPTLPVPPC